MSLLVFLNILVALPEIFKFFELVQELGVQSLLAGALLDGDLALADVADDLRLEGTAALLVEGGQGCLVLLGTGCPELEFLHELREVLGKLAS